MKLKIILCCLFVVGSRMSWSAPSAGANAKTYSVDVCIYGTTAAGVIAAYAARKSGRSVLLVGPEKMIGGMTTGGLGQTDFGHKEAITGLSRQFYLRVGKKYGLDDAQWQFEPSVASRVMDDYIKEGDIPVMLETELLKVGKEGTVIKYILLKDNKKPNGDPVRVNAREFIDCSYEGDLMAMAGVSFTTGRESNQKYNETIDGVQLAHYHQFPDGVDPYKVPGDPSSGLLWGISNDPLLPAGTGDDRIQAYCFRICLTDSTENMIPITRPDHYDPAKYELLLRLIKAQPGKRSLNDYFIWSRMPGRKTDVNNRGGFSTDMIGMNQNWPTAGYAAREAMLEEAVSYTKGLLYFYGHDKRVPDTLREQMLQWGYPKDEYRQFDHFTPQLYVREARRMTGEYVMTEHNCRGEAGVSDGVALASYTMDSHNCARIVMNGMVKNEGDVEVRIPHPYPISYRAITPKRNECTNLLVPVCLSASHIAYGSIRMEPVFMVLGQSAAMAASLAIKEKTSVQEINVKELQQWLKDDPYLNQ